MDSLPLIAAAAALAVLVVLAVIDLKTWLLPNPWVLTFACLGVVFHGASRFQFMSIDAMIFGALTGGGILYGIRMAGNAYYKQDTLGLGDVKLLAAAGLWLGVEGVVIALTLGAFAGLLHGLGVGLARAVKQRSRPNLSRLMIPAGPGFCIGIIATWVWMFYGYYWS